MARVPDHRVDALAEMSASRKVVHATVEFVDIAGLVAGSSTGEGLGNRFLAGIREADALCLVLRAFEDDNVPGDTDPVSDLGVLELELVLADAGTVESQIDKRRKAARADKSLAAEVAALERAQIGAAGGYPDLSLGADRRRAGPAEALLPLDQQARAGGGQPRRGPGRRRRRDRQARRRRAGLGTATSWRVSVELEAEAAQLDPASRTELLEGLGLGEGALPRVARRGLPPARPAHVPDNRREGKPGLDLPGRRQGAGVRRRDSLRPAAGLHPGRGDPLGRTAPARLVAGGQGRRQAARRGQGLRGRGRRRPRDPLQRLTAMSWLLRDGDVLATLSRSAGRGWPACLQGAVVLRGPALVHTLTPSHARALDVAWCGPAEVGSSQSCVSGASPSSRRYRVVGSRTSGAAGWWWPRPAPSSGGACRWATVSKSAEA